MNSCPFVSFLLSGFLFVRYLYGRLFQLLVSHSYRYRNLRAYLLLLILAPDTYFFTFYLFSSSFLRVLHLLSLFQFLFCLTAN